MSQLRIEGLEKQFGQVVALDGLGLKVERAELLVILSPRGFRARRRGRGLRQGPCE